MGCGCKRAVSKPKSVVKRTAPTNNGRSSSTTSRGRIIKRIIK